MKLFYRTQETQNHSGVNFNPMHQGGTLGEIYKRKKSTGSSFAGWNNWATTQELKPEDLLLCQIDRAA